MYKKIILSLIFVSSIFAEGRPALVETSTVKLQEVNPLQEFLGSVSFSNNSVLAAKNSGLVEKIYFKLGDKVKKGQILVRIDSKLINAQIIAAKANLNIAKKEEVSSSKDYTRYKKLLERKSITQKEYDDALLNTSSKSSRVLALNAKLNELIIQKSRKTIRAPFSGVIVEKFVNMAEWLNAGSKVLRIVDTSKLELTFFADISYVEGLKNTDNYTVMINKKAYKAKLQAAIVYGDKKTRTFPIKFTANVDKTFIFEGQEAKIKLSKSKKITALVVPRDAVIKRFGANMIFINDNGSALMSPVQIISYAGKNIAVSAKGLKEGSEVITKGNERVFPKQELKVINK
ncbi:MAG: efflux RND transporter periplasmic adaptor subunit [Campylobacteraceae bacterium]|nr:efflux RND transporter periplasmic adaptor subunit [Campylobacteraceae bacterium]